MITLQSIMNFERGQVVEYHSEPENKMAKVDHVDFFNRKVHVFCIDTYVYKNLDPNHLIIVKEAPDYGWSQSQKQILLDNPNMTDKQISDLTGKSPQAVNNYRSRHNLLKK